MRYNINLYATPSANLELVRLAGYNTGQILQTVVAASAQLNRQGRSTCIDELCNREVTQQEADDNLAFSKLIGSIPTELLPFFVIK